MISDLGLPLAVLEYSHAMLSLRDQAIKYSTGSSSAAQSMHVHPSHADVLYRPIPSITGPCCLPRCLQLPVKRGSRSASGQQFQVAAAELINKLIVQRCLSEQQ